MQISPLFSSPQRLRSGRLDPVPRSASATAPIRVLIGDSDRDFRGALCASFAADPRIEVVGEADDGAQALRLVRLLRPNVALVNEDMPSFGGAAIARILSSELPETRVVVLTRPLAGACR